jgi:CheY-like chemotaxis protein
VLRNGGHTVLTASDGLCALDVLARDRVDLLLSDVSMPVMRGPELASKARRVQPGLFILLMSGSERPDGYPVLAKPFRMQTLLAAVHDAVAPRLRQTASATAQ